MQITLKVRNHNLILTYLLIQNLKEINIRKVETIFFKNLE